MANWLLLFTHLSVIFFTAVRLSAARVQHPAPEFKATAVVEGQFKEIQLSDFKGKYLVFFFYPLDL